MFKCISSNGWIPKIYHLAKRYFNGSLDILCCQYYITIMASKAELISNINVFAEIAAFDYYLPIISEKQRVANVIEFP